MNDIKTIVHQLIYRHRLNNNNNNYHKLYFLNKHDIVAYKGEPNGNAYNHRKLANRLVNKYIYNDSKKNVKAVACLSKNYL